MFCNTLERDIDGSFLEAAEELFEMIFDYKYENLPSGRSIIEKFKVNYRSINLPNVPILSTSWNCNTNTAAGCGFFSRYYNQNPVYNQFHHAISIADD